MAKGLLFVISGPSGVGKGTIVRKVMELSNNTILSISATSRSIRPNEQEGISYFFISKEEFEKRINDGYFLEYQKVYDNYYGTPKQFVLDNLEKGINVILEIDIKGALEVKKNLPDAKMIFILPPSLKELKWRLTGRKSDSEEQISKRLSLAKPEIEQYTKFDYHVVNDDLQQTTKTIHNIMTGKKEKTNINKKIIDKILNEDF